MTGVRRPRMVSGFDRAYPINVFASRSLDCAIGSPRGGIAVRRSLKLTSQISDRSSASTIVPLRMLCEKLKKNAIGEYAWSDGR